MMPSPTYVPVIPTDRDVTFDGDITFNAQTTFTDHVHAEGANAVFVGVGTTTSQVVLAVRDDGDSARRLRITAGGVIDFGSGSATPDTNLYRSAANTLKTDDALVVAGTLDVTGAVALAAAATSTGAAASSVSYASLVTADTFDRFRILADGDMEWGSGSGARDVTLYRSAADILATDDDFAIKTVGKGLQVAEGANAKMGVSAAMVAGTVTISTTAVTANSRIYLTPQTLGTVARPAAVGVTARTAGTSFVITSSDATDTSTVAWMIVEPA